MDIHQSSGRLPAASNGNWPHHFALVVILRNQRWIAALGNSHPTSSPQSGERNIADRREGWAAWPGWIANSPSIRCSESFDRICDGVSRPRLMKDVRID